MRTELVPLIVCVVTVAVLLVGFAVPVMMSRLVKKHLPANSSKLADSMTCSIIESLVDRSDGSPGQKLPAFLPASQRGGGDFMRKLYTSSEFNILCRIVSTLGMLCLPGYRYLQQRSV